VSELGKRTLSGIVLVAVALTALALGGWVWELLCALVGLIVLIEWFTIARLFAGRALILWMAGALVYVGGAVAALVLTRHLFGLGITATLLASVWAVDIGAYFAGRTFGGPKLAPRLSPNKTWSGLIGGAIAATVVLFAFALYHRAGIGALGISAAKGAAIAVLAQAGDLFESWMKRRANVKDSGRLIPGHGGVFDRVDGLLAVAFANGILILINANG
jgi:phosphatidate cytidylyltransferase